MTPEERLATTLFRWHLQCGVDGVRWVDEDNLPCATSEAFCATEAEASALLPKWFESPYYDVQALMQVRYALTASGGAEADGYASALASILGGTTLSSVVSNYVPGDYARAWLRYQDELVTRQSA